MLTYIEVLMKKTEYVLFTCAIPFPYMDKFGRTSSFLKQHPFFNVHCFITDRSKDQDRRLFPRFK